MSVAGTVSRVKVVPAIVLVAAVLIKFASDAGVPFTETLSPPPIAQ